MDIRGGAQDSSNRIGRCFLIVALTTCSLAGEESHLTHVATVRRNDLSGVNSAAISHDGKFLYSTSWKADSINVFRRDAETGVLTHVDTLTSDRDLRGTTSICLSPDGKYAVAAAFQSKTVVLLRVDPKTGKLRMTDVSREGENGVRGLVFSIAAEFSPDSKFVFTSDPKGAGLSGVTTGATTVFRVTGSGKLRFVESNPGNEQCFAGIRWITVHPDTGTLYATCNKANTLVVAQPDESTGRIELIQVVRDNLDAAGLQGAMTSALSPDGRFLYTSSGRFEGDTAIGVYSLVKDGRVMLLQELSGDTGELPDFQGSNSIKVTPDGLNVYAAGTRSKSFVCLQRDPETGLLNCLETIHDGTPDEVSMRAGAAGIAISPDSKFVYVMVEDAGMIQIYRRPVKEDTPPADARGEPVSHREPSHS